MGYRLLQGHYLIVLSVTAPHDRMAARLRILETLERRRMETGDPNLGIGIEQVLIQICLNEIVCATVAVGEPFDSGTRGR